MRPFIAAQVLVAITATPDSGWKALGTGEPLISTTFTTPGTFIASAASKPRSEWRPGMTPEKLGEELDATVRLPGLANPWIPPIRNRIDMLATGIKSPIGVKVSGPDLAGIDALAAQVEQVAKGVPGVTSALAERLTGGRYLDIDIDRARAARHGLNIADLQSLVTAAIGGENIGETVEGRRRFPIAVRYPREWRDTPARLRELPLEVPPGRDLWPDIAARIDERVSRPAPANTAPEGAVLLSQVS